MSKFESPEAWLALEREEAAYWAGRSDVERAAAVRALIGELLRVARQQHPGPAAAADAVRRAEKVSMWVALKERLGCPSANRRSSKMSSDAP